MQTNYEAYDSFVLIKSGLYTLLKVAMSIGSGLLQMLWVC